MDKKATCIMPKPSRSPEIQYKGRDPEIWLGEIENAMKVIISKKKFHCLNVF